MSMYLRLSLSVIALCALSACSKGVSVGAENTSGIEQTRKSDVSKSKTLSANMSAKVTATMPAAQLIAQALRPVVEIADIDMPAYVRAVKFDAAPLLPVDAALARHGIGPDTQSIDEQHRAQATAALVSLAARAGDDSVALDTAQRLRTCLELVAAGDAAQARVCLTDYYSHVYAAAAILATAWPQKTPGIRGEAVDLVSKERSFPKPALARWVQGSVTLLHLSTKLQSGWVKGLEGQVLRDPDDARLTIAQRLFDTPLGDLQALAQRATGLTAVVSNGDLGAPLEVFVPSRNEYVTQTDKGLSLVRDGSVWHGEGLIAGAKTDIALEHSTSASLERKRSISTDQSDKSGSSTKAGATLQ